MTESWWNAHVFEFVLTAALIGVCAVWWLLASLGAAWAERKQKRKDGLL